MEVNKPVMIHLPVQRIQATNINDNNYKYSIFKWKDNGSLTLTDIEPLFKNGVISFEVNPISGYCCAAVVKSTGTPDTSALQEADNLKKRCNILFFVEEKRGKDIQIMLECVETQRISAICKIRKYCGSNFILEKIGKDVFLTPNKSIISVEVKGNFRIPKTKSVKSPVISFNPIAMENFTHFPVELIHSESEDSYCILSFKLGNEVIEEIHYGPISTENKLPSPCIDTSNIIKKIPVPCPKELDDEILPDKIREKDFFTTRAMLVVLKQLDEDELFKVCIDMNMTTAEYEFIRGKFSYNLQGDLTLLQTGLNYQSPGYKVKRLILALRNAYKRYLAKKVELAWLRGKDLHTISNLLNFPFPESKMRFYISELIFYAHASSNYADFIKCGVFVTQEMINQGYGVGQLKSELHKFYFNHYESVYQYDVSVSELKRDIFGSL